MNPGKIFRDTLQCDKPLQIVGTINAYTALLAQHVGFRAIYLSGAGVANASFGIPDLGITTMNDVLEDARRITSVVDVPLLVDIDTGWGNEFNIARTIREMIRANVAAVHIEDQVADKRCGHRPNKKVVPTTEMVDRIKAAVDARTDESFVIMARTDALALESMSATIDRVMQYVEAGADMIFFEAVKTLSEYALMTKQCPVPVLANMTEFGVTPLFTVDELKKVGIDLILYPLTAFRAMSSEALHIYRTLRKDGTQINLISSMQTREELYQFLDYYRFEKMVDKKNNLAKEQDK